MQVSSESLDPLYDLTTVTNAHIDVTLPNGTTQTWSASVISASKKLLTIRHTFALEDTPVLGDYELSAKLSVPGGELRVYPVIVPCKKLAPRS